jgi:hypothetical protein
LTTAPSGQSHVRKRLRIVLSAAVLAVVGVSAGLAVADQRHAFTSSLSKIGSTALLLSLAFGLIGTAASLPTWRAIMVGLGARLGWLESGRVFYLSQLGKYVPGSVWPTVLQMDAAQRKGFSRRIILSGNLVVLALSCSVGLLVAVVTLSLYDQTALSHYWWGLLAVPVLLVVLYPRTLPGLVDRGLAVLGRPPLGSRLDTRAEIAACGWALLAWLGLGGQLIVLAAAVHPLGFSTAVLCIGAVALAIPLGVLFVPAPAGAGIREAALVLVLSSVMTTGQALAVVIASRCILVICDVLLALAFLGVARRRPSLGANDGRE